MREFFCRSRVVALAGWFTCLLSACLFVANTQTADAKRRESNTKQAGQCSADLAQLRKAADGLDVAIGANNAVTGADIDVKWDMPRRWRAGKGRLYLIFATPGAVRFSGVGFFALAGGAPGPAGIADERASTRAIVVLHGSDRPVAGRLGIRAYQAGDLALTWKLIAKSACGEHVLRQDKISIAVSYGRPAIVVQDRFADDKPEKTVNSGDGRYRLVVFENRYQVFELQSGAKIVDRIGLEPNFSSTGRFIAAKGYSKEQLEVPLGLALPIYHDVIDLVTGELVLNDVTGPVGWAFDDSFIIDGGVKGRFGLRHTLIDRGGSRPLANRDDPPADDANWDAGTEPDPNATDRPLGVDICWWKGCVEWRQSYAAQINIDDGFAQFIADRGVDGRYIYLADISMNRIAKVDQLACRPGAGDKTNVVCRSQPTATSAKLAKALRTIDACCDRRGRWHDVTGTMHFTHLHDWDLSFRDKPDLALKERLIRRKAQPVRQAMQLAEASGAKTVRAGWRGALATNRRQPRQKTQDDQIVERLKTFGIVLDPGIRPQFIKPQSPALPDPNATVEAIDKFLRDAWRPLVSRIARDVPIAQQILSPGGGSSCMPPQGGKVGLDGLIGMWRWRLRDRVVWLFQGYCSVGTTPFTPFLDLNLLTARTGQPGSHVPLVPGYEDAIADYTHYRVAGMLNARAEQEAKAAGRTIEKDAVPIAIAKAIGSDPARVRLTQDGLLLLPIAAQLVIYDVNQDKVAKVIEGLVPHSNNLDAYLTRDRRHVVQINADGRLAVFDVASGGRILGGRYIDDEIILYDDNGYYDATYEGAHFVNLKFPGDFGLYSFQQFRAQLHRPDIIKARLAGRSTPLAPTLTAPPVIDLSIKQAGAGLITADINARSFVGLSAVRIYQDGQLLQQVPARTRLLSRQLQLTPVGGTRWITASAVDRLGLVSRPVAGLLERDGQLTSTLHATVIGIDTYDDHGLADLAYAVADSRTIDRALAGVHGKFYGAVELRRLANHEASARNILDSVAGMVDRSRAGDTLLFFFAGHGVRGSDGAYYLATSRTDANDPAPNALRWTMLKSLLSRSRARVVVLLDACHSGLAGAEAFATNDGAVAEIISGSSVPMLVLAASKGRQFSEERASLNGGVFTRAIESVIATDRGRYDLNGNGVIEVSEMYLGVKSRVKQQTRGRQTPWLARTDMIGDFALF